MKIKFMHKKNYIRYIDKKSEVDTYFDMDLMLSAIVENHNVDEKNSGYRYFKEC